jgi:hypothetical protein
LCFFRKRHEEFQDFYSDENDLVYFNNICGVMDVLDHEHKTAEWRLFIDSSKTRLKAVLLHIGNKYPSVPLAYATNVKELALFLNVNNSSHRGNKTLPQI